MTADVTQITNNIFDKHDEQQKHKYCMYINAATADDNHHHH